QVSWLTSLLHADILSSRFHQQANSPGSWTKLALKPLLLKRIQNASLETCVSWQTSLLHADILTNSPGSWAKLALNHPLLHKRIQNASWESWLRCGGPLTGHLGIHWLSLLQHKDLQQNHKFPKMHSGSSCRAVDGLTPAWPNFQDRET
ncbi:Bcl-2-related protein A1, partial [Frankliniella fusca]